MPQRADALALGNDASRHLTPKNKGQNAQMVSRAASPALADIVISPCIY